MYQIILTILIATIWGQCAYGLDMASLQSMGAEPGISLKYGTGQTNQETYAIATFTFAMERAEFVKKLEQHFVGKATVAVAPGNLVAITPVHSDMCATCTPASLDMVGQIRQTIFLSFIPAQGMTLAMAMPGSAPLALREKAKVISSPVLGSLVQSLDGQVFQRFQFAETAVTQSTSTLRKAPQAFLRALDQRLMAARYAAPGHLDTGLAADLAKELSFEGPFTYSKTWQGPSGMLSLHMERITSHSDIEVNLYEVRGS